MLIEARFCAEDTGADAWTFAVERSQLRRHGIGNHWLRWLIKKGLVEHAHEVLDDESDERHFDHHGRLRISSCFVLTSTGVDHACEQLGLPIPEMPAERSASGTSPDRPPSNGSPPVTPPQAAEAPRPFDPSRPSDDGGNGLRPRWDDALRILYLGDRVVKSFCRRAPNQEAILAAFEEEGWPAQVDDPIHPLDGGDSPRRLRGTVQNLNRQDEPQAIEFTCNGAGTGVRWQLLDP